ncbi:solute carrier family 25 member 45-like [Argonauta hians]
MKSECNPAYDFSIGAIAGWSGLIVGHPFDTLRVKLQVSDFDVLGNIMQSKDRTLSQAISIMNKEGLMNGYFRGFLSPLISYGLLNSIFFGVYGTLLCHLTPNMNINDSNESIYNINKAYFNNFLAGCAGGFVQTIPGCPFELTKIVLQSQVGHRPGIKYYQGPFEAGKDIIRRNGITGCYRGFILHNMRDIPSSGVYSLTYEFLRQQGTLHLPHISNDIRNFVAGGITGVISWVTIIPIEVIKTRYQADCHGTIYRSIWHCTKLTYIEGGIPLFFKGWLPLSIRAFLVNSITLMVYSYFINR